MPTAGGHRLHGLDPVTRERVARLASAANLARALTAEQAPELRWRKAPHLAYISSALVDVAFGRCDRLMVFAPPRHGKSKLISQWFPTWLLELFPHWRIMLTSYAAEFAREWGQLVRDTFLYYGDVLQTRLKADSQAANLWHTTAGGGMTTSGVGGGQTGRGANVLIIDDPIKNAIEAFSPTRRRQQWEWFESTASRRLEPGGAIVLTMQRWRDDDLAGQILAGPDGKRWRVIRLPALAERDDPLGRPLGASLWPERFDEAALAQISLEAGPYFWDAQYQQRPPALQDLAAYYAFDEFRNVSENAYLVDGWPLQMTVDFNRRPGMHAVLGQHFPDHDLITSRAVLHMPGMTIERMIGRVPAGVPLQPGSLLEFCAQHGGIDRHTRKWTGRWPHVELFGDATGSKTQESDGKSNWDFLQRELAACAIPFKVRVGKSNPGVVDRVNSVNAAFCGTDGRVRYLIHPDCVILVRDYKLVRNDELDKPGELTHASSADGYRIHYLMPIRPLELVGGRIGRATATRR